MVIFVLRRSRHTRLLYVSGMLSVVRPIYLVLIVVILFFERKESGRRMGWLLTLVFLPVTGFILYVLFSGHFFSHSKKMDRMYKFLNKKTKPSLEEQYLYFQENKKTFKNKIVRDYSDLVTMNLNNANSPITFTDSVELFSDGASIFE